MSDRVRMAYVGCGAISGMHTYGIESSGAPIDVVACVDTDLERAMAAAEPFGASAHTSMTDAIGADGIDAVDIMVPHRLTEALVNEAFDAGLHVLLEKPMAPTLEACDRILQRASSSGTVFMVAENAQYWPEVVTAKRLVEAGAIGEIVTARASFLIPPLESFYGEGAWRFDSAVATGGICVDTGSHWIRPLRMLLGEVESVVGVTGRPFDAMAGESLVRGLLRFESGVVAAIEGLLTAAPLGPEPLFRFTGSAGEIHIDAAGRCLVFDGTERRGRQEGPAAGYLSSYSGEFDDFAAAILSGRPPAAGPEQSVKELEVAFALYRSVESGRWEHT